MGNLRLFGGRSALVYTSVFSGHAKESYFYAHIKYAINRSNSAAFMSTQTMIFFSL